MRHIIYIVGGGGGMPSGVLVYFIPIKWSKKGLFRGFICLHLAEYFH